ncbi:DUF421 domain-containing protein [Sphingobacterium sp. FBM7-1]|uniref:DUF421 domain-containing protein n=1 Tax=Sphingobacterium sp. FBM7-1 TaxID=2886688 RepID=UPI001D0F8857|nr:YetF domain-containing protein [Sphingobacterium sp. FBM7-1]MCC2600570.1 DUF421 domain-containing protein [Sphingobacterium sp. FBM7-1]
MLAVILLSPFVVSLRSADIDDLFYVGDLVFYVFQVTIRRSNMENVFFNNWQSILETFLLGLLAYIALIIIVRISGKRTLSQMREFDFIVTVALGSTLATIFLSKDVTLADGIVGLSVLISLQYLLAYLSTRSTKFSRLISSEPTLVFYKGSFLQTALRKERVTEDEVRAVLRSKGVTSIELVEAVVMEVNGQFTVVEQGSLHDDDSPLCNVRRIG